MPFDDFKTLPEGLAVTPTMQPVAWAVPDRDDGEIWYVTMWRDEAIRAAGGNAFALIPLYTLGVRLSGVAAAAATAADVARSVAETPDERHDAATCCGERQEPDVGEGWVGLGPDEILQADDECDVGGNCRQWVPTLRAGQRVGIEDTYRRRVTPDVPKAPQSRPAETRDTSRQHVIDYDRETRNWNERIAKADAELARGAAIQSEVARLRAENATLRSEVERLRMTPDELDFIRSATAELNPFTWDMRIFRNMLKRLGGDS